MVCSPLRRFLKSAFAAASQRSEFVRSNILRERSTPIQRRHSQLRRGMRVLPGMVIWDFSGQWKRTDGVSALPGSPDRAVSAPLAKAVEVAAQIESRWLFAEQLVHSFLCVAI